VILRTERECRNDTRFVVCKDRDEAQSTQSAGMLWVMCGDGGGERWAWQHQSQFARPLAYYECWPAKDFAVLVEQEDE
jgi:hypothetical protein